MRRDRHQSRKHASVRRRVLAVVAILGVLGSACTGTGTEDSDPGPRIDAAPTSASSPTGQSATHDGWDRDAGGAAPTDGATTTPNSQSGEQNAGGTDSSSGQTAQPTTDGGGGQPSVEPTTPSGGGGGSASPFEADLYGTQEAQVGITDSEIRICGHAALVFAEAFNTRVEDLNVYWEAVNDNGGVHGRSVRVTYEDDAYNPNQAIAAAERCKEKNPFFLLGGIGFDQIPAVRSWAEENRMLYLHHIAVEAGLDGKQFSFTNQPSVDDYGRAFGEYLAANHADRSIGIVWRQSENWEPGHRAGAAELEARGIKVEQDLPVTQNQSVYTQQILALQNAEVEVVWLWENALGATEFIQQARNQGYNPTWVLAPFQTTLDVTGAIDVEGVATWPAYAQGGYSGNPFAEFDYGAEIARFEQTMAERRPGVEPNDILWQVWIGHKFLHDLLERCGADCNRNRFAGLFLSGMKNRINPNCPVDFSRGAFPGRLGGHQFFAHEGVDHSSGFVFATTRWCSDHLI